jgi:Raf kinase inhibitor-like YbhB/YbcL family protein
MRKFFAFLFILIFSIPIYGGDSMKIFSNSFKNNEYIPKKFTCEGLDVSPHLQWENVPDGTKSYVLIVDDPDAPVGIWVHWVVYNIPANIKSFTENINFKNTQIKQGLNDFGKLNYGGPCPPRGKPHRYFFKIYAVDIPTDFKEGLTKNEIINKISSHIIDEAELIGLFKR